MLKGKARIPGDKSISHRALILAALAVGASRIENLCDGDDIAATIAALRQLGAKIEREEDGAWRVAGVGAGGLIQPAHPFDLGNSGTSARLLTGLIASHPIRARFTGDASLSGRPMARVAKPLRSIGAGIDGDRLPMDVAGIYPALPRTHRLDVPSAQVKSALLLAALNTPGITTVIESTETRDHLERMLPLFDAEIAVDGTELRLRGEVELRPHDLSVAGDASAAAFLVVAALIVPGSDIRIEGVGMNPRRTGFYEMLGEMGADIVFKNERERSGEPVADLVVRHSPLRGIDIPAEIAPRMIDEYPILFVAAAFAEGETRARGLAELRFKESDRIAAMAVGLAAVGVRVEESADGLIVHGGGSGPLPGGAIVAANSDHRVAMSFAVAGLHAKEPIGVDDMSPVATSFPGFAAALADLAAA